MVLLCLVNALGQGSATKFGLGTIFFLTQLQTRIRSSAGTTCFCYLKFFIPHLYFNTTAFSYCLILKYQSIRDIWKKVSQICLRYITNLTHIVYLSFFFFFLVQSDFSFSAICTISNRSHPCDFQKTRGAYSENNIKDV